MARVTFHSFIRRALLLKWLCRFMGALSLDNWITDLSICWLLFDDGITSHLLKDGIVGIKSLKGCLYIFHPSEDKQL